MTKEETIKKEKKKLKKQIKALDKQLDAVLPNKQYTCPGCKRRTQIKNVSIISQMAYKEPYSCTGGDYWYFSEYLIYCPKCGECARAYDFYGWNADKDRKKAEKKNKFPKHAERFRFVKEYYQYFREHLEWCKRGNGIFDDNSVTLEELREQKKKKDRSW